MNNILLKLKTGSFGEKAVILVGGIIGLVVTLGVIIWVFSFVFFGGSNFSIMGANDKSLGMIYQGVASNEMMAYDSGYGGDGYAKRGSVGSIGVMPPISPDAPASTVTLPAEKKIIRNGSLNLLVEKAEESAAEIQNIATKYSGFVDSSNIYEVSDGVKSGNIVIRVPEDKFVLALSDIKKIATKVTSENVNATDVTSQIVDLEASIKNMKVEEGQYRQIMAQAVKIQDILDVSSRLADVRGRIDRTQGQLNYLSRQVVMSTISISLTAQAEVEVFGIVWRPLTVLKQAFKNLLSDLAGFVDYLVIFIFKLPVLILRLALFVAIISVLWKMGRWAKKRFF